MHPAAAMPLAVLLDLRSSQAGPSISRAIFRTNILPSSPFVFNLVPVTSRLSVNVGHGTAIRYGPTAHPYTDE